MLQYCFLSKKKKKKKKGEDVTILRDIVTTSWSADHIGFLLLNIYLVGPTSWICVLFYITRSGLLQCRLLAWPRIKVLWNQRLSYPWRPYKLTRSRSPCTRKSWRVSVLAAKSSLQSYFPQLLLFRPRRFSFPVLERNLSSQNIKLNDTSERIRRFIRVVPP